MNTHIERLMSCSRHPNVPRAQLQTLLCPCGAGLVESNKIFVTKSSRGLVIVDDLGDDEEQGILLPVKREVCPRCDGTGVHDHPAFSNGLTQSDFDEDPDFREDYFRGRYDVVCETCHGRNVVSIPDEKRMKPAQIEALHSYYADERANRAEQEAERRMGA